MSTTAYNTLTIQLQTPPSLPWSEQQSSFNSSNLDLVLLPWLSLQSMKDSLCSLANTAQPGLIDAIVDGQFSAIAPIATITYSSSSGAQTVTIGGVAVPSVPAAGTTDAITAANTAAAINASTAHQLVAFAYVLAASPTVVNVQGKWPGPGLNTIAFAATGTGATVSAATLGGSAAGNARAGVSWSQQNRYAVGSNTGIPAFP